MTVLPGLHLPPLGNGNNSWLIVRLKWRLCIGVISTVSSIHSVINKIVAKIKKVALERTRITSWIESCMNELQQTVSSKIGNIFHFPFHLLFCSVNLLLPHHDVEPLSPAPWIWAGPVATSKKVLLPWDQHTLRIPRHEEELCRVKPRE